MPPFILSYAAVFHLSDPFHRGIFIVWLVFFQYHAIPHPLADHRSIAQTAHQPLERHPSGQATYPKMDGYTDLLCVHYPIDVLVELIVFTSHQQSADHLVRDGSGRNLPPGAGTYRTDRAGALSVPAIGKQTGLPL